MGVRSFDPNKRVPLKRLLEPLFRSRAMTWFAINVGQHIDPILMRATRGRIRIGILAPTVLLRHTGRKSGATRTVPLLYFTHEGKVVLIASKGGAPKHPDWYLNIMAKPDVEASSDGRFEPYLAREAQGAEREKLWRLANDLYSGYDDYQKRTSRRIPVVVLEAAK